MIVLEDLSYIREHLDYGKWMNRRLHNWAFARLTGRIEDKARDEGIPCSVREPGVHQSQTCHACGHLGSRSSQAACSDAQTSECWVTEYQADINASVPTSHGRLNPWGERCALKPHTDDSPRDGSASDSTTGHREPSRESRQTTLGDFSSETSDDEASLVGSTAHLGG